MGSKSVGIQACGIQACGIHPCHHACVHSSCKANWIHPGGIQTHRIQADAITPTPPHTRTPWIHAPTLLAFRPPARLCNARFMIGLPLFSFMIAGIGSHWWQGQERRPRRADRERHPRDPAQPAVRCAAGAEQRTGGKVGARVVSARAAGSIAPDDRSGSVRVDPRRVVSSLRSAGRLAAPPRGVAARSPREAVAGPLQGEVVRPQPPVERSAARLSSTDRPAVGSIRRWDGRADRVRRR